MFPHSYIACLVALLVPTLQCFVPPIQSDAQTLKLKYLILYHLIQSFPEEFLSNLENFNIYF